MVHRLSSIRPPGLWAEEGQLDRRRSTDVCVEENPTQAAWIRLLSCEHGINHLMSLREREYGLSDIQIMEKEIEFVLRLSSLCDVNISFDLNVQLQFNNELISNVPKQLEHSKQALVDLADFENIIEAHPIFPLNAEPEPVKSSIDFPSILSRHRFLVLLLCNSSWLRQPPTHSCFAHHLYDASCRHSLDLRW